MKKGIDELSDVIVCDVIVGLRDLITIYMDTDIGIDYDGI